jgi:hypothetical protein
MFGDVCVPPCPHSKRSSLVTCFLCQNSLCYIPWLRPLDMAPLSDHAVCVAVCVSPRLVFKVGCCPPSLFFPRPSTSSSTIDHDYKAHSTRRWGQIPRLQHLCISAPLRLETYRPSNSIMIKKMYEGVHVFAGSKQHSIDYMFLVACLPI